MFRREIKFETTLMMLSLRWRRHGAPRFSLFGKRLTLATPNVAGRKFDRVDEFGRSCRPVTSSRISEVGPPSRARLMNEEFGTARNWFHAIGVLTSDAATVAAKSLPATESRRATN
jgi:hypothetical protein